MNVLSLFDGISCGQLALKRTGIEYSKYYSSEIEPHAIKVTQRNFPNTIQLGDVRNINGLDLLQLPPIDLLMGGSPCQGFTTIGASKLLSFDDPRSKLFFEFVRLKNETKPKWFLLENVVMRQDHQDVISNYLGVRPILIDSKDFSGNMRRRLYWTNIPVLPWKPLNIHVHSVIEQDYTPNSVAWHRWFIDNKDYQLKKQYSRIINYHEKAICQTARQFISWNGNLIELNNGQYRFLTPTECERLQTIPDAYTSGIPKMERYKALGNGWTVDVVAHIFKGLGRYGR